MQNICFCIGLKRVFCWKMKKILFFIESLSGGGAEKVLVNLIKNIDRSKFDITVMCVVKTGVYVNEISRCCRLLSMLPDINSLNSPIGKLKYKLEYKMIYEQSVKKVYKQYIQEEYDIEVAFVEGFATKFIAASNNYKSKKVCWIHIDMENNQYADSYYTSLEEEKLVYEKYDKIIGVSKTVKEVFERKFGVLNKVQVIYNPIDTLEIKRKIKYDNSISKKNFTIITIGRLEKQKGYDRLIRTLIKLKNYNFTMWILGEGSERRYLQDLIQSNKMQDKICLLGYKKNPYKWLRVADAFVCTSRAEGYSLAIAEAMVLGIPVFSVDCAGPNELLNYGEYGVLVENTDRAIYDMLFNLLTGKYNLEKYKNLSISRQSFFDISSVIHTIEEMFSDL